MKEKLVRMQDDVMHHPTPAAKARSRPGGKKAFRWRLFTAVAVACVIGSVAAWTIYHTRLASRTLAYATTPVSIGPIVRTVTATGTVNPVLTIIIGSYVSGVIQTISCDFNTQVKIGQVCATIDPRPYQVVVDQDAAELNNAKAQLIKDQAALAYARMTYSRDLSLVKKGYVAQDAVDAAKSAYDEAAATIVLDRASVESHQATLQAAQVNLEYTHIVSPVVGTVVSRNVTIGQTVAASFQTPTLFLIATDMTRMQVDTNVSENDIGAIHEGQQASFRVESFANRPFTATVVQVRQAPQTIQNVVTYDVVLGADNRNLLLKPGMTATVKLVTDAREHVVRIPDQALRFKPADASAATLSPEEKQVWTLIDGRPVAVPVVLGLDDDSFSEVLGGKLKPGQAVIVGEQANAGHAATNTAPHFNP
ncbi:MAG TPA: efflux RND transporter periplasmic adaptor subunit [Dyella sp.]|uniref:efflux RND transporter periplasmic adaptor subunit n=1 Tax=Dyella sp. TaxID=1869338 RepID=UPI002C9C0C61|nr:efflux RND transporter periplasmic adaptor subunit [Dyella sp.]HUB90653.1 efflux RND transporter periplasmic adaptor subunit [Dyella sp.]